MRGSAARRRRRMAVAGVVVATALTTVGLAASAAAPVGEVGGRAAAFLPADGAVGRQIGPDGTTTQWEQAITAANPAVFLLPDPLASYVFDTYPTDDPDASAWVSLGDSATRSGALARDLHTVTADGIRLVASVGGAADAGFSPALLSLPADVAAGESWASEGEVFVATTDDAGAPSYGTFAYEAQSSARAPTDERLAAAVESGCLEVTLRITFTGSEGAVSSDGVDLWCPRRGLVASADDSGITLPTTSSRPAPVSTDAVGPDWPDPADWTARPFGVGWDDPLWEDPAFAVSPSIPPAVLGDDRLAVDDSSGDVVVLRVAGDRLVVDRVLHPGGRILGLSAVGDLLVASTGERRIAAYDADGARRWTRALPDLVYAPVVAGGDGLVVAGLDGVLRLVDPETGEDRWATPVSASGVERIVVAGDVAVAADQTGGLVGVDLADGALRWQVTADETFVALAATGDTVVGGTGVDIRAVDAGTGETRWETDAGTSVTGLAVAGETVVVTTLGDTVAVGLADGAVRWRGVSTAERVVSDGTTAVVEGDGAVAALDSDGDVAAEWPVPAESLGSARFLAVSPAGVWLVDSVTGLVHLGGAVR